MIGCLKLEAKLEIMIQNYSTLKLQVQNLNTIIDRSVQLQKIFSTSFYLCFAFRVPGKSLYFYLGRGKGFEGLWVGKEKPESFLRKREQFLEYLRKHLTNTKLIKISMPVADRLLVLEYFKWGVVNKLALFYKGRDLLFLHSYKTQDHFKVFSNTGIKKDHDCVLENQDIVEHWKDQLKHFEERAIKNESIEKLLSLELEKAKNQSATKKNRSLVRKKDKIEADLKRIKRWSKIKSHLDSYYAQKFNLNEPIEGEKIKFKGELSDGKKLDLWYQKVKKLKRGAEIQKSRLKEVESQIKAKEVSINGLSAIAIKFPKNLKQKILKEKKYRTSSGNGYELGWGLNASGNDQLRKEWGKKDDLWFHLNGESSSHIIMKGVKLSELSLQHFQEIAAKYQEILDSPRREFDLVYSELKGIKGVKGKAGAVTIRKPRYRVVTIS